MDIDDTAIVDTCDTQHSPPKKKRCLPSEDDKIRESVDVGSVFLALDANFFTAQALLKWLTTQTINERRQVAYKAVCTKIHPNQQYLDDTFHFLTKKPGYTFIAIGFGLLVEIPDQNIEGVTNPVLAHVCDALVEMSASANIRRLSGLILAGQGSASYLQSKLVTCFRARNFPHLRNLSGHEYNIALVEADYTSKFRYNEKLAGLIIRRIAKLHKEAPIYYSGVAYKAYHKIGVKLNKDKLLTQLTRDELTTFNTFFPNVIDQKILGYSDLAYKIALLGNDVAGYILGFPVQNIIPNEDQIHQSIQELTDLGPDKYADHIKQYVVSTYTPILPFSQQTVTYSNDADVLMEDINNYAPFDIISYQTGSHMYRFTRPEFDQLSESKKNPWTNDWLPPTVLSTIKARVDASKELGLPPARPLRDMLTRIEDGTLFQSDTDPTPVPLPTSVPQPQDPALTNTLGTMMTAALMGQWAPGLPAEIENGPPPIFGQNVLPLNSNLFGAPFPGRQVQTQFDFEFEFNDPREDPLAALFATRSYGGNPLLTPLLNPGNVIITVDNDLEDMPVLEDMPGLESDESSEMPGLESDESSEMNRVD